MMPASPWSMVTMEPSWEWMWALAIAIYAGCKGLTWWTASRRNVPLWKQAAYLFGWPGMDAAGFFAEPSMARPCRTGEWVRAPANVAGGLLLFFGVARVVPPRHAYFVGWIGIMGIVLILHFGIFYWLSCFWRSFGIGARLLMNHPLASAGLSEFWGRRWNTAFRDLTHRFLFRPLTARLGPRWGMLAGFVFSGAVHDLVISVPARGGYGGPTLYFTLQGAAMLVERSTLGRRLGLGSGWIGWAFAMLMLIGPVFLLFHRPFVVGIIVPFMRALGAVR